MCRITRVDRIVTPLFIYAGANDPRVPHAQSDQLAARLREHGVPVEYICYRNQIHGFVSMAGAIDEGRQFLDQAAAALRKALHA